MAAQTISYDWGVTKEKVEEAVRRIVARADPLQIIVFGSRARVRLPCTAKRRKAYEGAYKRPWSKLSDDAQSRKIDGGIGAIGREASYIALRPFGLEPFAVELRYDMGSEITDADRIAMLDTVVALREYVVARILELERQP